MKIQTKEWQFEPPHVREMREQLGQIREQLQRMHRPSAAGWKTLRDGVAAMRQWRARVPTMQKLLAPLRLEKPAGSDAWSAFATQYREKPRRFTGTRPKLISLGANIHDGFAPLQQFKRALNELSQQQTARGALGQLHEEIRRLVADRSKLALPAIKAPAAAVEIGAALKAFGAEFAPIRSLLKGADASGAAVIRAQVLKQEMRALNPPSDHIERASQMVGAVNQRVLERIWATTLDNQRMVKQILAHQKNTPPPPPGATWGAA
ncbi:MAG: hypothetical protein NTY53_17410 [Kiritimatiellaeota bacterium]|nr:hypothetical protein [Kiritimatiellota bacterium]